MTNSYTGWCVRSMRQVFVLCFAVCTGFSGTVFAGPGVWTSAGPEGGVINGLIASPNAVNTFYAVGRGVFKSTDGGINWTPANAGITRPVNGLILHSRTAANTLYTFGGRNVFFSNDGATSWQDRSPPGLMDGVSIFAADLSPVFPGRIYIGLTDGSVLRSDDAGQTWVATSPLPLPDLVINQITTHPSAPNTLLVTTTSSVTFGESRIFRGTAAGGVWTEITCAAGPCPWFNTQIADLKFAGSSGKAWMSDGFMIYQSLDFGSTWTAVSFPPIIPGGQTLTPNPDDDDELFVGGRIGLAYTEDNGTSWTEVFDGFVGNSSLQTAQSTNVAYDPFNTSIQLAGSDGNGVYRRVSAAMDVWQPNVSGMNSVTVRSVAVASGNRLHAALADVFTPAFVNFRSTNNGTSWSQANTGLQADHFRALMVDPNNDQIMYASGRYFPHTNNMGDFDNGNGAIYKSSDAGINWTTIDNGIPQEPTIGLSFFGTVRSLALDLTSGSGGGSGPIQTLYAAGSGSFVDDGMGMPMQRAARIYKSTDAGATWVASDNGIGSAQARPTGGFISASGVQILQDPNDATGNNLYAATFIGGLDGSFTPTIPNGVFRTTDGGANWIEVSNGLPTVDGIPAASAANVLSLALDPTDATGLTLYASTNDFSNSFDGTIYKTTDGGANWVFSGTGLMDRDVRDLVVDPLTGDVYAAVADPSTNGDGGVFISSDGGATWSSISVGFPASAVGLKLLLDDSGPNLVIHAGTTRSLQSFEVLPDDDVDGVPDATEAAAPNGGDGNLDGTQDSTQADVSSVLPSTPGRGDSEYVTVVLTPLTGNCNNLENVTGLDTIDSVPPETSYRLPFNGVQLRIPDCESAQIDLIYHNRNFESSAQMRSYALEFPDEERFMWQQIPGASVNGNTWSFNLSDGQVGDSTSEDNVILFLGGPATLNEVFFDDGMEVE